MTLTKEPGLPKETHTVAEARHLFDVHAYVDDFNAVIDAYGANAADAALPADRNVARSILPPGTAAVRDFSHLAPRVPEFIADRCVGCMSCVNVCPDTAILGIALPESRVAERIEAFAAAGEAGTGAAETARSHFAATRKYGVVPEKRGLEPALFGIFVDPVHCKGCGECAEVCTALGYDALTMVDKVTDRPGEPILAQYERDMRF
ncbi:MAG TPA: 4Fe-4S binding protein, partial [Candidatus Limnocylindria bacterium]|nr:4Fe-4S binding protein [Candidatus Limnocylindria bacterium]